MLISPRIIPILAGQAFWERIIDSTERASFRFCGYERPWVIILDLRVTTGKWEERAERTSKEKIDLISDYFYF